MEASKTGRTLHTRRYAPEVSTAPGEVEEDQEGRTLRRLAGVKSNFHQEDGAPSPAVTSTLAPQPPSPPTLDLRSPGHALLALKGGGICLSAG